MVTENRRRKCVTRDTGTDPKLDKTVGFSCPFDGLNASSTESSLLVPLVGTEHDAQKTLGIIDGGCGNAGKFKSSSVSPFLISLGAFSWWADACAIVGSNPLLIDSSLDVS
jgi:transcription elongation factor Elf1